MNTLESIVKQLEIRCEETLKRHEQACRDHGEANRLYVKQLELAEAIEGLRIEQESINIDVVRLMSEIHWTEISVVPNDPKDQGLADAATQAVNFLANSGQITPFGQYPTDAPEEDYGKEHTTWNGVKYEAKPQIVQTAAGLEIGTPVKKPIVRPRKDAPQEAQTPSLAAVPGSNEPVGHIPSVKASVLAYALTRKCPVTLLLTDDVRKVLGPAGDGDVSEQFFDGDKAGIEEAAEEAEALAAVAGAKGLKGSVALLQEYQGKQIQLWAVTFAGKDHK